MLLCRPSLGVSALDHYIRKPSSLILTSTIYPLSMSKVIIYFSWEKLPTMKWRSIIYQLFKNSSVQASNSSRRSIVWSPLVEDFIHIHPSLLLCKDTFKIGVEDLMTLIWDILHTFGASVLMDSRIWILHKDFLITKVISSIYFVYAYIISIIFQG